MAHPPDTPSDRPPTLWLRLDLGGGARLGPGKIALLEAIGTHASISAAARAQKMSYKRAWDLVEAVNRVLPTPAVETRIGGASRGGAVLTPLGVALIEQYRRIEATAATATAAERVTLAQLLGSGAPN